MVVSEVVATILLLLQLTIYCDAETSQSLCHGDTCHVSPENFLQLKEVINSNRLIILDGVKFSLDRSIGFIIIENVCNLTITGGGSGSLIECSPQSSFGLHLKNATNVTLTGINITNCASVIGFAINGFGQFSCSVDSCQTPILIEASRHINIARVEIEHPVGLDMNYPTNKPLKQSYAVRNTNLRQTNFIHKQLCMVILDSKSLLIERTVIANCTYGILSYASAIIMKEVDVVNCKISLMNDGHMAVRERLTVRNSCFNIYKQVVSIYSSRVLFLGENTNFGLIGFSSKIFIGDNSAVVFTKFKNRALTLNSNSHLRITNSTLKFIENTPNSNIVDGFFNLYTGRMDIMNGSSLIIAWNSMMRDNTAVMLQDCNIVLNAGKFIAESNVGQNLSYIILAKFAYFKLQNESCFSITRNEWLTVIITGGDMTITQDSTLLVLGNIAGDNIISFIVLDKNSKLRGKVIVANNTAYQSASVSMVSTELEFTGILEVVGNRGISGGIYAYESVIVFTGTANFSDNNGTNGGAMTLHSSLMYISSNATVEFNRNTAQELGGAIYIWRPRIVHGCLEYLTCSTRLMPGMFDLFSIIFNQNKAGIAGNAIYGGLTMACIPSADIRFCINRAVSPINLYKYNGVNDSSDLSNFTSDPTRVCFCENGIPDCYKAINNITVHPGEKFHISLAIVGYGLGTVPGSAIARGSGGGEGSTEVGEVQSLFGSRLEGVQEIRGRQCQDVGYSIVSVRDREQIALAVETESFSISLKEARGVLLGYDANVYQYLYHTLPDEFYHIPVFLDVNLLPCPIGFQLVRGRCVCHRILQDNNIHSCSFSNGTALILRPAPYWIGLPNDTNTSILVHPLCPYDYCQSEDLNITAKTINTQCQYQRTGVLCGSCHEGLSMIVGSSECKTCSNIYLVSIIVFILMGVALVTLVTLLNMTVSVGTLNGLILFANILQANRTTFLPQSTHHTSSLIAFLSAFIAWLNLDLGIPMCFFDGLTTYIKTWLQFVFPLYILVLVGVIIIASKYSTRVTRLLGTNTVSVLATLILLSYTKILRIIITAFSFTTVTGSQGYHSVVWLPDGNIKYFEPIHTVLFLVALLVLLLLGVPYTVTLTAAPWIQKSRFKWVSSLYNRFKPLFDAYMGPYKDKYRYWTGMLLLARVVLIVLFSSIANTNTVAGPQLNLLLLTVSSCILLALTAAFKPYKLIMLNGLEIFHLTILFIFSSTNLYVSHVGTGVGPRAYIYIVLVGICFFVFLGISVGHIWYRVRKARTVRRPEPPEREEEEYRPLVWQRTRIRAEDEEREEVTISTAGATNTISNGERRESLVELIANADLQQ